MKKFAQGFNTAAQDSNPGSLSRESGALPLSHCELNSQSACVRACVHACVGVLNIMSDILNISLDVLCSIELAGMTICIPLRYAPSTQLFVFTGIIMQHGPHHKSLRRFTLRALRDLGMGKSSLEEKIKDEVQFVLAVFDSQQGVPCDPKQLFDKAVSNIICSIIFGQRSV